MYYFRGEGRLYSNVMNPKGFDTGREKRVGTAYASLLLVAGLHVVLHMFPDMTYR